MNQLGKKGELLATNYLIANGYKILEMNYYNKKGYRLGEVDLIGEDKNGTVVFFEVKSRKGSLETVSPEAAIDNKKLNNIFKIAHLFLRDKKWLEREWRVDFIGIFFNFKTRRAGIRHIKALYC
ncbi:MAG: YraN family protein [Candidatus Moraniibacteriota bacterium]